jgi:hypothetical protein
MTSRQSKSVSLSWTREPTLWFNSASSIRSSRMALVAAAVLLRRSRSDDAVIALTSKTTTLI